MESGCTTGASAAAFLEYVEDAQIIAITKWVIGAVGTLEAQWTCKLTWILVRDGEMTDIATSSIVCLSITLASTVQRLRIHQK